MLAISNEDKGEEKDTTESCNVNIRLSQRMHNKQREVTKNAQQVARSHIVSLSLLFLEVQIPYVMIQSYKNIYKNEFYAAMFRNIGIRY